MLIHQVSFLFYSIVVDSRAKKVIEYLKIYFFLLHNIDEQVICSLIRGFHRYQKISLTSHEICRKEDDIYFEKCLIQLFTKISFFFMARISSEFTLSFHRFFSFPSIREQENEFLVTETIPLIVV